MNPKKTSKTIPYSVEMVATIELDTEGLIPIPNKNVPLGPSEAENGIKVAIMIRKYILHANKARGRCSLVRGVRKALRNGKPIHAFCDGGELGPLTTTKDIKLLFPLEAFNETVINSRKEGVLIGLYRPKEGIPVYFGKDWYENLEALRRKAERWYPFSKLIKS